jgi:ribosomal protein L32
MESTKTDLQQAVKELEASFSMQKCGHCGKEFYRTHFNICADCLTLHQTRKESTGR